ncbi:MAG: response regulator [Magnetococcales bacterium]|nr:response regulator [Magnetococcales bacterium]
MKNRIITVLPFLILSLTATVSLLWNLHLIDILSATNSEIDTSSITIIFAHFVIWVIGVIAIYLIQEHVTKQNLHLEQVEQNLSQQTNSLSAIKKEKELLLTEFRKQSKKIVQHNKDLERHSQTRAVTNRLLLDSLEPLSLSEHLEEAMFLITAIPWFALQPKGAIFLWDENKQELYLKVHYGLSTPLLSLCSTVPKGHCICGLAAQNKQTVFVSHMDEKHSNTFAGIVDHGHYCLPILMGEKLLGVLNLYVDKGHTPTDEEEIFLRVITSTLAGIIVRCQQDEQLSKAKQIAEESTKAKSIFLANMSHEIRTPMNAIVGLGHLLLQTELTAKQKNYLNKISFSSQILLNIINNILDFSKIEAGKLDLETTEFNLNELLHNVIMLAEQKSSSKGVKLLLSFPEKLPCMLVGDPLRLGQIITNLLDNAVKFTETGFIKIFIETLNQEKAVASQLQTQNDTNKITATSLDTSKKSNELTTLEHPTDDSSLNQTQERIVYQFSVQDSGIGMHQEQQAELFKPFNQGDSSTTRKFGGTGLGLSISKQLAEIMGGKIWVESELGKGSTFSFTASFIKANSDKTKYLNTDEIKARESFNTPLSKSDKPSLAPIIGARILIVEDNEINQEVAKEILEREGLKVEVVNDGYEAVIALETKKQKFDAVLMDVQMPIMDGYQATRIIRNNPDNIALPILAMTANATPQDRENTLAAGMNDHINKPIDVKLLFRCLLKFIKPTNNKKDATKTQNTKEKLDFTNIFPSELPGIDIKLGLDILGDNKTLFARLLMMFYEKNQGLGKELREIVAKGNSQDARSFLHKTGGTASNIAAQDFFTVIKNLSSAIKQQEKEGNTKLTGLDSHLDQFEITLEQILESGRILNKLAGKIRES